MSQSALKEVFDLIASAPKGSNPYYYIASTLVNLILPVTDVGLDVNLILNACLLSLGFIFALITVGLKIKRREAWCFKLKNTSMGKIILPNSTYLFAVTCCVFIVAAQIDIWPTYLAQLHKMNPTMCIYTPVFKYIALWSALFLEAHGMASSAYLCTYQSYTRNRIRIPAWCLNLFFLLCYLLILVPSLVIFMIAAAIFGEAWVLVQQLQRSLREAGQNWDGSAFKIQSAWFDKFGDIVNKLDRFNALSQAGYTYLLACLCLVMVSFLAAAVFYTHILRQQAKKTSAKITQVFASDKKQKDSHIADLSRTYRVLLWKMIGIFLGGCAYIGIGVLPVSEYGKATSNGKQYTIIVSGQFWVFSIFGLPVLALLAYRTINDKTYKKPKTTTSFSILPSILDNIMITTLTETHVERNLDMPEIKLEQFLVALGGGDDKESFQL